MNKPPISLNSHLWEFKIFDDGNHYVCSKCQVRTKEYFTIGGTIWIDSDRISEIDSSEYLPLIIDCKYANRCN